jgi:hypothetical protein
MAGAAEIKEGALKQKSVYLHMYWKDESDVSLIRSLMASCSRCEQLLKM